ncbi:hypothetical protein XENTR_v10006928 [Xenopus tropicalis]|nr:hypothetical protein XENTR_v10006928 [Xenopus tropicalis]
MHCCLCEILLLLAGLAALLLTLLLIVAHVTAKKMPNLHRSEEEKYFTDSKGKKEPFPSIHDPPTKDLSVVVPSYNEEERLPVMMDEAMEFLEQRQKKQPSFNYEVIVVDDGSRDKTTEVAFKYCKKYGSDKVRVLTLKKNRGKGGAVRMGVLVSRGKLILMADADGATKFADIKNVEVGLEKLKPWPVSNGHILWFKSSPGERLHSTEICVQDIPHVWLPLPSVVPLCATCKRHPMWIQTADEGSSSTHLLCSSCRPLGV